MLPPQLLNRDGFILLPILVTLALLALLTYMLNRAGGLEGRVADSQATTMQARYLAEAGLRHAKWFLAADCTYRVALTAIPFGAGHTYGAVLTDNSDGTIHLLATGVVNGQDPDPATHFSEIVTDDYLCQQQTPMALYWSDWGHHIIRRAELDGSGVTDLLTAENGLVTPKPLAVDLKNSKMYWGDANVISRSDVDGSFMEEVVDCGTCLVSGLDVDPANNAFYYTDQTNNRISRAELNGKNNTVLISSGLSQPGSLRLDLVNGRLYFADAGNSALKSAQLDGTGLQTVTTAIQPTALALDTKAKQLYYFDTNNRNLQRLNYNGGGLATIIPLGGGVEVKGLDLDLTSKLIYWGRHDSTRLQRAKFDGTARTDLVVSAGGSKPWDLRLGPAQPIVVPRSKGPYWTEDQGNKKKVVRRAELDGTNLRTLVAGQNLATNIKFDPLTEQLFWGGDKKIMRSTVKGGGLTVVLDCNLVATCASVYGLALDPTNQRIYFVDQSDKSIKRVNYAGTQVTTLVSSLTTPWDIDLDLARGKMYWVDSGTNSLRRANLDGSSRSTILSDSTVQQPYAIAVDSTNSYLYWFDNNQTKVYRSTLTGNSVTTLLSSATVKVIHALALDLAGGKLYWADNSLKKIGRANLNGTAAETVVDLTTESNKPPWGVVIVPASL